MAPKQWSNQSLLSIAEAQSIFARHSKSLERMSWKSMDLEEFSEGYLKLLQDLGRQSIKVNRVELRRALSKAHLSLTPSEIRSLADKIVGTITFIKDKLRNAGSGKFLPHPVSSMLKIWASNHQKNKAASADTATEARAASRDTAKEAKAASADTAKAEAKAASADTAKEAKVKAARTSTSSPVTSSLPTSSSAADPYTHDIRSTFGLEPKSAKKKCAVMVNLCGSESESEEAQNACVPVVDKPSATSSGSIQVTCGKKRAFFHPPQKNLCITSGECSAST